MGMYNISPPPHSFQQLAHAHMFTGIVSRDEYFLKGLKIRTVFFLMSTNGFDIFDSLFTKKLQNKFSGCLCEIHKF
jgi:hypothetical protein